MKCSWCEKDVNYIDEEGYCLGNIIKYLSRYKHKNGVEDLKKCRWYLDKLIKVTEVENG